MSYRSVSLVSARVWWLAVVACSAGCSLAGPPGDRAPSSSGPDLVLTEPGIPDEIGPLPRPGAEDHPPQIDPGVLDPGTDDPGGGEAKCDPSIQIQPDSEALIVTDPAALAALPLEKVIANLDWNPENRILTMQRLFDTLNDDAGAATDTEFHCDTMNNPAFTMAFPSSCPRPEGALAESEGFFTDGDPDRFIPIAAVNRFDLRASPNDPRCGEFRLIYAKASGKTDPDDRVFLIFEASVPAPSGPAGEDSCYPLLKAWKAAADAPDPAARGALLADLFLVGPPDIGPIITRENLGQQVFGGGYGGAVTQGRVRLSLHSGAAREWHELHVVASPFGGVDFAPLPVAATPALILFDAAVWEASASFRVDFLNTQLPKLAAHDVGDMGITPPSGVLAGDSALGAGSDYASAGAKNPALQLALQLRIDGYGYSADCPPDDPFTPDAALRRVTAGTCAGCHAPEQALGPERKVGCGVAWPASLGGVHIDEHGNLSPALKELHLPRRAHDLQKHLHGCVD